MAPPRTEVDVGGRVLRLSNLDKVLWPGSGFTKGDMISYYQAVAPAMIPHLAGRALTLRRWPDGVDGETWYEKNCPSHKPPWVATVRMGGIDYCSAGEAATLVWLANLAAIELHPTLAAAPEMERPTAVVFDLDPGAPAGMVECARLALTIRELTDRLGLRMWAKTSGSKGLQLYLPVNGPATYEQTRGFALAVARLVESASPETVVTTQDRSARQGKVLIDWSQNTASKTTVGAYSLRATPVPAASTPVAWEEVESAADGGDATRLRFSPGDVLARLDEIGEIMAPVLSTVQQLPRLAA